MQKDGKNEKDMVVDRMFPVGNYDDEGTDRCHER